jgi:hypothetical protein
MEPGELVVPLGHCTLYAMPESGRTSGRSRTWESDRPAVMVGEYIRKGHDDETRWHKILIDEEVWIVSAGIWLDSLDEAR